MPNWVTTIICEDCKSVELDKYFTNKVLDFNKIIPIPNNLTVTHNDWMVDNWGSRAIGQGEGYNADENWYWFQTAWDSPIKVLKRLAELTKKELALLICDESDGIVWKTSLMLQKNKCIVGSSIKIGEYHFIDDYDIQDKKILNLFKAIEKYKDGG